MGMLAFEAKEAMSCPGSESSTCAGIWSFATRCLLSLGEQCSDVCAPARSHHESSFGCAPCRDALPRRGRDQCHRGSNSARSLFVQSISLRRVRGRSLAGRSFALASRHGRYRASDRKAMVGPNLCEAARRRSDVFFDGWPSLGSSRTIRGVVAAVAATAPGALVLGEPATTGALLGDGAMLGDTGASFIKRRFGTAPGSRATGLDPIPDALLTLLAMKAMKATRGTLLQSTAITFIFSVLEIPLACRRDPPGSRFRPWLKRQLVPR